MKRFSLTSKMLGKILVPFAVVVVAVTIGSCSKKENLGIGHNESSTGVSQKTAIMHREVDRILRGFVTAQAGGSSQQSFAGSGSSVYSNVTMTTTTHSEPNRITTTWSEPSNPGIVYTFSDASSSGGGLGQLSYNGKSFDYNYVLSIKVSSTDGSEWASIAGSGQELRAIIAIQGELEAESFTVVNLAIFLAIGTAGEGSFELNYFDDGISGDGFAIGSLADFSDLATPTMANWQDAKLYYTSAGHVNVTATSFEMGSDAKVKDVETGSEYTIDGALMSE